MAIALAWPAGGASVPYHQVAAIRADPVPAVPATSDKDGDGDDPVTVTGPIPTGSLVIDIIDDDGYTPASLEIDLGQQVTFVNQHHDEHTATGGGFDTGIIQPGATSTVTFDTPGRYAFACQFHAEMTGTIAVRGADGVVPEPSPVASPPAEAVAIDIVDFEFAPLSLTIPVDTTVVWTDAGQSPHTVTAADESFGSDILEPAGTFAHTFDTPGTFAYACRLHPEMQAVIVVEGTASGSGAPSSPSASSPPA